MELKALLSSEKYAQFESQIQALSADQLFTVQEMIICGCTIEEALQHCDSINDICVKTPMCVRDIMSVKNAFIPTPTQESFIFIQLANWGIDGFKASKCLIHIYSCLINLNPIDYNVFNKGAFNVFAQIKKQNWDNRRFLSVFGVAHAAIARKLIMEGKWN